MVGAVRLMPKETIYRVRSSQDKFRNPVCHCKNRSAEMGSHLARIQGGRQIRETQRTKVGRRPD